MTREVEEVTVKEMNNYGKNSTVETHPAFGSAVFSRRSGFVGKLFGSNLPNHQNTIVLTIKKCERIHNLSSDSYHPQERLIEVEFSAAQFAELLTTMNTHAGTPCTIKSLNGKWVPFIPDTEVTEAERIENAFSADLAEHVESMQDIEDEVCDILDKKSIGKGDRGAIKDLFYKARRFLVDAAPFAAASMVEVKEEVVAFLTFGIGFPVGYYAGLDKAECECPPQDAGAPVVDIEPPICVEMPDHIETDTEDLDEAFDKAIAAVNRRIDSWYKDPEFYAHWKMGEGDAGFSMLVVELPNHRPNIYAGETTPWGTCFSVISDYVGNRIVRSCSIKAKDFTILGGKQYNKELKRELGKQ